MGNRPDCAYFLLLGLCGAIFLLSIGGILTFNLTFNFHSIQGVEHYGPSPALFPSSMSSVQNEGSPHPILNAEKSTRHGESEQKEEMSKFAKSHQGSNNGESQSGQTLKDDSSEREKPLKDKNSQESASHENETPGGSSRRLLQSWNKNKTADSPSSNTPQSSSSSSNSSRLTLGRGKHNIGYYMLAIIGPLCLLMGTIVLLIVGVLGLKYDCDHEPETQIAFLRLKSELSLNFDGEKNSYELLRRVPTSSTTRDQSRDTINV